MPPHAVHPFPGQRGRSFAPRPEDWIHAQPSLEDLLDDDVILPVLRRDGLTKDDVRRIVGRVGGAMRRSPCQNAA